MLTKAQIKRRLKKIMAIFFRVRLKNKDFSILSNNCWGGVIYDKYALPYRTPTIGLWIPPDDYIKFLRNLEYYCGQEMKQIKYTECHVRELLEERKKSGRYNFELETLIIGRIVDVDIIFIHYSSFEDAKQKWDRRKCRLNTNNLLVKMNDQNNCTKQNMVDFLALDYHNKIFFSGNEEWKDYEGVTYLEKYKAAGYVVNDTARGDVKLDTTSILNKLK